MRKLFSLFILFALFLVSCGNSDRISIALPNDTTNEARALQLLHQIGLISLREDAGITATILDITDNPHKIVFNEVEAAQLPGILRDVDYAVINSNFAIAAGLNPATSALALEGAFSAYGNIIAVREDKLGNPLVKALMAALYSAEVKQFIDGKYKGAVVSTVDNTTDGFDPSLDYEALRGQTISVAASPTPHAEILAIAAGILAQKGIVLKIDEFTDYVVPNNVVEDGTYLANYFQHLPYLEDFNNQHGTHLKSAGAVHVEPLGIYGGKKSSLDELNK